MVCFEGKSDLLLQKIKKTLTFAFPYNYGVVAQLVEHRTENPGVGGSSPPRTTIKVSPAHCGAFFYRTHLAYLFLLFY